jgi:hypothetical protein
MTTTDYKIEHRHEYELALGLMGLEPKDTPTDEQHNSAVARADAHIAALKRENREDAIQPLLKLTESLE